MNKPDALTLVIFGASGDLTRRKLMPALYLLYTVASPFCCVGDGTYVL